jgi:ribulose-phosphate 3-epimerase
MTINPGCGRQRFMPMTLPKIRQVRRLIAQFDLGCELELDGGIDATTAPLGVAAGADVLVAGSAVFDHDDGVTAAMRHLQAAIVSKEAELRFFMKRPEYSLRKLAPLDSRQIA